MKSCIAKNSPSTRCRRAASRSASESGKWIWRRAVPKGVGSRSRGEPVVEAEEVEALQDAEDGGAVHALGDALGEPVDGRDAVDVDRELLALDDLEFGMIDVELAGALLRLAEDDELVARGDHLLHVIDIEPAADQPGAERGGGSSSSVTSTIVRPPRRRLTATPGPCRRRRRAARIPRAGSDRTCGGPRSASGNGSADPRW